MDVHSVNGKPTISKPFLVLFTTIQVICGVDFGYTKLLSKKWGIILKLPSIFFALCIAVLLTQPNLEIYMGLFFNLLYSAEYLTYVSLLSFSSYTLYEYLFEFEKSVPKTENDQIVRAVVSRAVVFPFLTVLLKILVVVTYCFYSDIKDCFIGNLTETYIVYFFMIITNYAFDSIILIQFLIMYVYYRHMKLLKSKVVDHDINASELLKVYRNIMDAVDKIRPVCNNLIMTCVIIAVPRFMSNEYMVLHQIKIGTHWLSLVMQYTVVLVRGFLMFLPSLTAEAVNSQSDDILLTLHNDLVDTTDEEKRFKIQEALQYMGARPSQYYVWRRVPVDARLPMAVVSLMTTYLIVIVQFTHLFD